jgi:hypothetical protein
VCTDILGHRRRIGSGIWIPGTGTKGSADISSTINGMSVKPEIKNARTHDRQSQVQKFYQAEIEANRGVYLIVTSFAQIIN